MKITSFTEKGRRKTNQDFVMIEKVGQNTDLILVADGMGGYDGGDIASKMVCESICTYLSSQTVINQDAIQKAVNKSNLAVRQYQSDHGIKMGTTIGGIVISENESCCFWVGDVKIIHFRAGEIIYESKDHTLISEMVEHGSVASAERIEKYRHVVTRSIHGEVKDAVIGFEQLGPIACGDILMACTDGITDVMDAYSIHECLYSSDNIEDGINRIKELVEVEGRDNYSGVWVNEFRRGKMRYDYLKQVEYLNSLGLVDKNKLKIQYYDLFYVTETECDFEVPFQFYQEYINREEKKYGFTPTLLAFIHNGNINAFAWKSNSLIGINAGTIIQMSELFRRIEYKSLIKDELETFDILDKVGQEGFLEKMYKYCQMFTFFHELGHIIQDDLRDNTFHFTEMVDCGAYSQEVHLMEYDADQYAAIQIANHINQWMESLEGKFKQAYYRKEMAEMLLSIATGAIFINYLIFQGRHEGFYTNSCSHPHPAIRVSYIMDTIVKAFKQGNKAKFHIEHKSVIGNAFILAERVENDANGRKVIFTKGGEFRRFFEIWEANQKEILEYVNVLKAMALETDGLAVKKYLNRFN